MDDLMDGVIDHQNPGAKKARAECFLSGNFPPPSNLLVCINRGWYRPKSPESRKKELSQSLESVLVPKECLGLVGTAPCSLSKPPRFVC